MLLPAAALTDPRLLRPTRLTAADAAIRRLAATMAGQDRLETADRFCAYVHEAISYAHGVTSVATTAAEALAGGRGVCQDAAHVMIALCRAIGLPARYVSGHLLGEGGTHAWVEVIVADADAARAVALDPCNGCRVGVNYLTVAIGRDYTDVAPTSGTYHRHRPRHPDSHQADRRRAALTFPMPKISVADLWTGLSRAPSAPNCELTREPLCFLGGLPPRTQTHNF